MIAGVTDVREVEADLQVPQVVAGEPVAGRRVKQAHLDYVGTDVRHVLYLPKNWQPGKTYPVIVEYAGNGPYRSVQGDVCSGDVQGSRLGYGMSGGRDFIWLCLPFLNAAGDSNVTWWWGDKPGYAAGPTVDYCKKVVPWVCDTYGGDPERVLLTGFSRGAIACNYIGLYDDEIAKLWCGFVPFSHYDGVQEDWPYPGADRVAALERLRRLKGRPQFVMAEGSGGEGTRKYLQGTGIELSEISFWGTGFRNHSDAWILRPSPARVALREWLAEVVK